MKNTILCIVLLLFTLIVFSHGTTKDKKHYIIYMGHHSLPNSESVIRANHEMLSSVIGRHLQSLAGIFQEAADASVHHYTKTFRGFSAMLTPDQAQKLAESDSVVSVFESGMSKIHTTQSWNFLRLDSAQQYNEIPMSLKSDVIVGVIDTGIWPESKSLNDYGLGPVPSRFKGQCETGEMFTSANCNRKIIGARYYLKGFLAGGKPLESYNQTIFGSPRDADGHGTHTASTIAGSLVSDVSLLGLANGTARGGAPSARLAIYKAGWFGIFYDADILAAFDDAIHDGVDILSLSFGPDSPQANNFTDVLSIGTFHAFQNGIVVSGSVGNSMFPKTAVNLAPWIISVAASTINRELQSSINLGNSSIITGHGLNPSDLETATGLILGSQAALPGIPLTNASFCQTNTLNANMTKGKIVVCNLENDTDRIQMRIYIRSIGGVGMMGIDPMAQDLLFQFGLQVTVITPEEAEELQAYIAAEKNPVARISQTSTFMSTKVAPAMASFSSKGPNVITPDIIKPDVTAPGVNILAAWSPPALLAAGGRSYDYNIISGTSMACPHVSALAAILKACHPSWSPAAIKSAIMTTASPFDDTGNYIRRHPNNSIANPFDCGSGHINPVAAINPGLVYDFDTNDIIDFLCSNGASTAQLRNLTGETLYCKKPLKPSYNFNYPSIGVSSMTGSLSVYRTVTYVGNGPTVHKPEIESPSGVNVSVTPSVLNLTCEGDKFTFRVDIHPYKASNGSFVFGALTWSNGIHRARSPIALNVVSV